MKRYVGVALSSLSLAITFYATKPALAQSPTSVWFAGAAVGDSPSGYAGAIVALGAGGIGHGVAVRVSGNGGRYGYDTGDSHIGANYSGGEVAVIYQTSSATWGWANFSAGPRYTYTKLNPVDLGNDRRGPRWDAGLQTDGALDQPHWRLGWLGAYGVRDNAYQSRLQVGGKLSTLMRIGVEGGVQGDHTYTKSMLGGFMGISVTNSMEIQLGGGVTEQAGRERRPYGSIGLSQLF